MANNYKVKMVDLQNKYKFKIFCSSQMYDDSELKRELEAVYKAFPKASGTGTDASLDGTAAAIMNIDLKGNTSQETTTGKNLLGLSNISTYTTQGITYSINNGIITLSGTANGTGGAAIIDLLLINPIQASLGTLTKSLNPTGTYTGVQTSLRGQNANTSVGLWSNDAINKTETISANAYNLRIQINNGVSVNCTFKPQVEAGSNATDFEPYTNGASPNPDYPQEVKNVTGDNTINITGKNLLEPNSFAQKVIDSPYSAYNVSTYNSDTGELSIMMGNNSAVFDDFKENTRYTLIFKYNSTTNALNLKIDYTDGTSQNINIATGVSNGIVRYVTTSGKSVKRISHSAGDSSGSRIIYLKESGIFEGVIETTDFEPFGKTYVVNLGTLELCKIGDYQDYIYKEGKKWYKYGAISKIVLDGSETWTSNAYGTNSWNLLNVISTNYVEANLQIMSNLFTGIPSSQRNSAGSNVIYTASNTIAVIRNTSFTTEAQVQNATNGSILYYVSATPTPEEITDATLISQLNNLRYNAESYEGTTNISQTNNDLPFIITASAIKDLSNL